MTAQSDVTRQPRHKPANPFIVNEQGVFYNDGDEKRWICSRLEIQALVRDKASENWDDY